MSFWALEDDLTTRKINAFLKEEKGWHFGEGVPTIPSVAALARDLNLIAKKRQFRKTDVFPGVNGELAFTVYDDNWYYEFFINENSKVDITTEKDDIEQECVEGLSASECKRILREIKDGQWNRSESFTSNTGTAKKKEVQQYSIQSVVKRIRT